tara:strand:+ start:8366 stop:9745 length:1380 start_codon:yes stop_codon:yes gene_type:complete
MSNAKWLKSLNCIEGRHISFDDVLNWINVRREETEVKVDRVTLSSMSHWQLNSASNAISHTTGRFFSIKGLRVSGIGPNLNSWDQPIIDQQEIGVLGCIVKEIKGILHFLVQAKIEPGNINVVQLSPTLQATRSNYTLQHKGRAPKYLEYFNGAKPVTVLLDQLQTEQGSRFFRKRNRNIVVQTNEDIEVDSEFIWLTLGQIKKLALIDNVINMDLRTVLSLIPLQHHYSQTPTNHLLSELVGAISSTEDSLFSYNEIMSWVVNLRAISDRTTSIYSINELQDWSINEDGVFHSQRRHFDIIWAHITISNREVSSWDQPIVRPRDHGLIGFFVKKVQDQWYFLVQAKMECGSFEPVELTSSLCFVPSSYSNPEREIPFYSYFLQASQEDFILDTMQSEEGGRFFHEQNRNFILNIDHKFSYSATEFPEYKWMTYSQLLKFMAHSNYVSIQARSLLSLIG